MKRRDFLLMRSDQCQRVAVLSCERLYMHYQQAGVTSGASSAPPTAADDFQDEEPPAVFTERTTAQLFEEVRRELEAADVVQVVGDEWLAVDAFRRDVEHVLTAFRRRGGRVEYPSGAPGG